MAGQGGGRGRTDGTPVLLVLGGILLVGAYWHRRSGTLAVTVVEWALVAVLATTAGHASITQRPTAALSGRVSAGTIAGSTAAGGLLKARICKYVGWLKCDRKPAHR